MKKVLFTISGIFIIIALIVAFQNIMIDTDVGIFFSYSNISLFFPLSLMYVFGVFTGFFIALAIKTKSSSNDDVDEF